jgi:hypothetical protein
LARIEIVGFDITESAEAKFWEHGIVREQVEAVLDHPWTVIRNRAGRAAPFVLIGRDDQSRCLAIPIAPTYDRLFWRPITAWRCKRSEAAKLR